VKGIERDLIAKEKATINLSIERDFASNKPFDQTTAKATINLSMTNSLSPFLINSSAVSRRRRKDGINKIASRGRARTRLDGKGESNKLTHSRATLVENKRKVSIFKFKITKESWLWENVIVKH
jgi:hypothetical protein